MTPWSNAYVGLRWAEKGASRDGVSCWGLVRLRYATDHGIDLPGYDGDFACAAERAEVCAVITRATTIGPWHPVREAEVRDDDVAVFRIGGIDAHVGLVCGPGLMLTVSRRKDSEVVQWTSWLWRSRLSGFYRHVALMDAARVD